MVIHLNDCVGKSREIVELIILPWFAFKIKQKITRIYALSLNDCVELKSY